MFAKKIIFLICLGLSPFVAAGFIEYAEHNHQDDDRYTLGPGGNLDRDGGHESGETSKKRGVCVGYHYHRRGR